MADIKIQAAIVHSDGLSIAVSMPCAMYGLVVSSISDPEKFYRVRLV